MRRVIWGCLTTSAIMLSTTAVRAQTLVADEIRVPYSAMEEGDVGGGPYPAPVPRGYADYDEVVPPFQAMRMLRASGYDPMGPPIRQRGVYIVPVVNAQGYEGRVAIDMRTGRVIRFIPAAFGGDDEVEAYGPPGLPPVPFERMNARTLRPPASVPHVASRTPAPRSEPRPEARRIEASPAAPTVQQQAAATPGRTSEPAVAGKPVDARPPVQLQPTQQMPPVQTLE